MAIVLFNITENIAAIKRLGIGLANTKITNSRILKLLGVKLMMVLNNLPYKKMLLLLR